MVRGDIAEVDRDWKGQLEFPPCMDTYHRAVKFLAGE